MATRKAEWTLPTAYSNGVPISPEAAAKLITHVYRDGVEVAASAPGATSVEFEVEEVPGQSYAYTAKSEVDGVADDLSGPSEVVLLAVPFLVVNPPTNLAVS